MIEKKSSRMIQHIIYNLIFICISVFCVAPVLLIVSAAFTQEDALIRNGYGFWPSEFSLDAMEYLFENPMPILRAYGVTIFVTVVGTIASLIFTSGLAYVMARKDFKYHNQLSFFVFFTMLFSGGMVPSYIINTQVYHLYDTIWALILPMVVGAWNVFLMKGFFADLPTSLVESAKIDGASEVRAFFSIIVPISKPAFATVGLLVSFGYWNDWWHSMLYTQSVELVSLQFYLYRIMNSIEFLKNSFLSMMNITIDVSNLPSETARMAICLVAAGPMLVIFPFFQKYFVKGISVGSIKG